MSEGATNTANVLRYFQGFTRKFVNNSKGEGGKYGREAFEFFLEEKFIFEWLGRMKRESRRIVF